MRKARYDMKQVICPKASCLGFSSNVARPGYWITWDSGAGSPTVGRVLGRIAEDDYGSPRVVGHIAVMALFSDLTHAGVRWVAPDEVRSCHIDPPADLLAWITGRDWVKNKVDIHRLIAMSEHGTCSDDYIHKRNDPEQAYNARPEYVAQFIIGG